MPVSDIRNIVPIMNEVARLDPEGIIDLGIGFGKYGVLCREYLEAVHGRCRIDQWERRIVGIEGHRAYENPAWGAYNEVIDGDIRSLWQQVKGWPLVLMIDSLEHFDELEARTILEYLVRNNKRVIVSVPLGVCPQGAEFGNEFETHRSVWSGRKDFEKYSFVVLREDERGLVISIKGDA